MAFDKYKDGAWQEPEDTVRRYADGAWQECEFANRYKNDAWEAVWEAIKYMSQQNNTLKSGTIAGHITDTGNGEGWAIWYFEGGDTGGGSVTYFLDGDFVNPTISFDYDGWFGYTPSDTYIQSVVGKVDVYTRTTDGTESYTTADNSVVVKEGTKNYSATLNGTYNRVGFRFTFQNWGSGVDTYEPQYLFNIYNILINGKECLPSEECAMK